MDPGELLRIGCEILAPPLIFHGYARRPVTSGSGSGGTYARTEYERAERRLELHFRYSLGLVTYHLGAFSVSHEDYMRVVLGRRGDNQYPGFSDDPLDGFRHLRHDLERYCAAFLSGSDEEMEWIAAAAAEQAKIIGFKRRLRSDGPDR